MNEREWSTGREGRAAVEVVVGAGCFISGTLRLVGNCRIEGTVDGEISAIDELTIAAGATVNAKVSGRCVRIAGNVLGDIECSEHLELTRGACVKGNLHTPSLVIADGVSFEGFCSMKAESPEFEEDSEIELLELSTQLDNEAI